MVFGITMGVMTLLIGFCALVFGIKEKKPFVIAGGAVGMLSGFLFLIYSSNENIMCLIAAIAVLVIFAAVVTIILLAQKAARKAAAEREWEALQEKQRQDKEKRRLETAKALYKDCIERGVASIDSDEGLKKLRVIAASHYIKDIEEAKETFLLGAKLISDDEQKQKAEQEAKRLKEIAEDVKRELEKNNEALKKAFCVGSDKYLYTKRHTPSSDSSGASLEDIAHKLGTYTAPQRDWAIEGGLSTAIGGLGAGLAAAADAQNYNNAALAQQKAIREAGVALYMMSQSGAARKAPTAAEKRKAEQEAHIIKALCDQLDPEKKFAKLTFSDWSFSQLPTGNITATGAMSAKSVKVLDKPAVLDGSLKLRLYDENNVCVAEGVYLAPGFDEVDLDRVGFARVRSIKATCIATEAGKKLKSVDGLRCEVSPIKIWAIEKEKK